MKKLILSLLLSSCSFMLAMNEKKSLAHNTCCGHTTVQEKISVKAEKEKLAARLGISTRSLKMSHDSKYVHIFTGEGNGNYIIIHRCILHNDFPEEAIAKAKAKLKGIWIHLSLNTIRYY